MRYSPGTILITICLTIIMALLMAYMLLTRFNRPSTSPSTNNEPANSRPNNYLESESYSNTQDQTDDRVPSPDNIPILSDHKLIYGPSAINFDAAAYIATTYPNSHLMAHREQVEGRMLSGVAIIQLVADRTRIDPRVLLTALELTSRWLSQTNSDEDPYPLDYHQAGHEGLYWQLDWAANQINWGYYARAEGSAKQFTAANGTQITFDQATNFGSSAIQHWLGQYPLNEAQIEREAVRFRQLYVQLFGSIMPTDGRVSDQLWTDSERQLLLRLPWEDGETWYMTSGPHGGWNTGTAWAALDFVPPAPTEPVQSYCQMSPYWAVAVADGVIVRSDAGAVVLDLDGDGYAGTGWAILYQHIAEEDRIPVNSRVFAGDRIGHPSCEGGFSTATHMHLARTYNGRWVSADQPPRFDLGGWQSVGDGDEYNGRLIKNGVEKTATQGRYESNGITAP